MAGLNPLWISQFLVYIEQGEGEQHPRITGTISILYSVAERIELYILIFWQWMIRWGMLKIVYVETKITVHKLTSKWIKGKE